MFGMGLTLSWQNFMAVLRKPRTVGLGVLLQYAVMPFAAWVIAGLLGLPPYLMAGLVLVGACPGGTACNVVCYLARGDGRGRGRCLGGRAAQSARPGLRLLAAAAARYGRADMPEPGHRGGMQNPGLGVALAVKYFSAAAALPGALFSIWHNLSGSMLAGYWSRHVS